MDILLQMIHFGDYCNMFCSTLCTTSVRYSHPINIISPVDVRFCYIIRYVNIKVSWNDKIDINSLASPFLFFTYNITELNSFNIYLT